MKIKKGMTVFSNLGCASMGYGLPAAIGACIGSKKDIILITGDGSIMMNLQELQTIITYQLPIKIFILENNGYLAIRTTQTAYFDKKFVGESPQSGVSFPNFKKIASAFGIKYVEIGSEVNIDSQLSYVLGMDGSVICEIKMNPNQTLYPKTGAEKTPEGKIIPKPMEEMFPAISKDINIIYNG
jgi:acetolactate synthase-1/2/3 large subunit